MLTGKIEIIQTSERSIQELYPEAKFWILKKIGWVIYLTSSKLLSEKVLQLYFKNNVLVFFAFFFTIRNC